VDLGVFLFNIILNHLELIHNKRNKKQEIKHKELGIDNLKNLTERSH